MLCYGSYSNDKQISSMFFKENLFCFTNYINIFFEVTFLGTMKTTSLTRIYSNCLLSLILQFQVSQSTSQELVAFQVQSFKFDRPSSLTQQQKPLGHKFTLGTGSSLFVISEDFIEKKRRGRGGLVFAALFRYSQSPGLCLE